MKARSVLAVLVVVGLLSVSAFGQEGLQEPVGDQDLPQILDDATLGLIPGQDVGEVPSVTIYPGATGGWGEVVIDAKQYELGSYALYYGAKDDVSYPDREPLGIFTGDPAAQWPGFIFNEDKDKTINQGLTFGQGVVGEFSLGNVIGEEFGSLSADTILENLRVTFTVANQAGTYNGRTTIIPEPSTIVMLLCGVVGLLVWRRRRS